MKGELNCRSYLNKDNKYKINEITIEKRLSKKNNNAVINVSEIAIKIKKGSNKTFDILPSNADFLTINLDDSSFCFD